MYSSLRLLGYIGYTVAAASVLVFFGTLNSTHTPDAAFAFDASSTNYFVRQNILSQGTITSGAPIDKGLVGYWTFDEGVGTVVEDYSLTGNQGTLVNTPTFTTSALAKKGKAIVFNGLESTSGNYINIPDNSVLEGFTALSVCAWAYLNSNNVGFRTIISKSMTAYNTPYADPYELWLFGIKGTSWSGFGQAQTLSLRISTGIAGSVVDSSSAVTVSFNAWHYLCGTYDKTTIRLYIDGRADTNTAASTITIGTNAMPVTIGNYGASNEFDTWDGRIDELRVYNRALSAIEIGNLYQLGSTTYSLATSTSFKLVGAGGQTAVGSSTSSSFNLFGGYLKSLFRGPQPIYEQTHFHWRNDDGSETTATSATGGSQDTAETGLSEGTTIRLRVEVSNEGGTKTSWTPQQFRLEYGLLVTTCSAIGAWTDVGAGGGDWDMSASANITDAADTTNIAISTGGVADSNHTFLTPNGATKDTGSSVASQSITSEHFIEIEYSIVALAAANDTGTYCFRVTNAGSTTYFTYTQYPQVTMTASSLTFTTDAGSQTFPNVTPGTLSATTSILTIQTANPTGFIITANRTDSTGTMSQGSVYIPDKTNWSNPGATTTPGNATASTTEPLTLQFRVRSAGTDTPNYASSWWGTADTTAAALFAGFPSTAKTIVNRSTAAGSNTFVRVLYNLNVPATQQTGVYTGNLTYTATANP